MIGEALREAREARGLTQKQIGEIGFISNKMVSAVERGNRKTGNDVMLRITTALDYHRLYMEAAEEVTGGVCCTPWLDSEVVDLHRTSVWAKLQEELREALEHASEANVINNPKFIGEAELREVYDSLMQALDARVAIDHYVAVMCEEYDFSIRAVYQEHRRKLESRGYIRQQKKKGSK